MHRWFPLLFGKWMCGSFIYQRSPARSPTSFFLFLLDPASNHSSPPQPSHPLKPGEVAYSTGRLAIYGRLTFETSWLAVAQRNITCLFLKVSICDSFLSVSQWLRGNWALVKPTGNPLIVQPLQGFIQLSSGYCSQKCLFSFSTRRQFCFFLSDYIVGERDFSCLGKNV